MSDFTPKIIAFTGLKGSGKSTAVEILKKYYYNNHSIHILSFAAPLKRLVTDIFCLTNNECYDPDLKEVVLPNWNVTPRELLQKIGTELFRNQLTIICPNLQMPSNTIWVSSMYHRIKQIEIENELKGITKSIVLIDDCRFDDEYDAIKDLGGTVINITRDWKMAFWHDFTPPPDKIKGYQRMVGKKEFDISMNMLKNSSNQKDRIANEKEVEECLNVVRQQSDHHASEMGCKYDHIVLNDGSIEELESNLCSILHKQ
jgi:hypothetical protein